MHCTFHGLRSWLLTDAGPRSRPYPRYSGSSARECTSDGNGTRHDAKHENDKKLQSRAGCRVEDVENLKTEIVHWQDVSIGRGEGVIVGRNVLGH